MFVLYGLCLFVCILSCCSQSLEQDSTSVVLERSSLYSCAAACSSCTKCISFEFVKTNLTCQLRETTVAQPTNISSPNYKVIVNNRWSQNVAGPCNEMSCICVWYTCPECMDCTVKRDNRPIPSTSMPIPCGPAEFQRVGRLCVKIHLDKMNWANAKSVCQTEGARLVQVDTEEKHRAMQNFLRAKCFSQFSYYIGATEESKLLLYFWEDGSEVDNYGWAPSEPNQSCVIYRKETLQWSNINCGENQTFICEFQMNSNNDG